MIDFHIKDQDFATLHEEISAKFEDLIGYETVFRVMNVHKCTFFLQNLLKG